MEKRTWEEFVGSGTLWFVNRLLHVFGWAIVLEYDENDRCVASYPARTRAIGFPLEQDLECRRAFLQQLDPRFLEPKTVPEDLTDEERGVLAKVEALSDA
jgi:hypothetical protein